MADLIMNFDKDDKPKKHGKFEKSLKKIINTDLNGFNLDVIDEQASQCEDIEDYKTF